MTKKSKSIRSKPRPASAALQKEGESGLPSPMNASLNAFLLFDEKLSCVGVNAVGRLADVELEQALLGKGIVDIIPDTRDAGRYDEYMKVISTGEPYIADDVVACWKSEHMHFGVKAFRVGNGLGIVVSETTEREQAEDELRRSEEYFRSLIENSLEGIVILNCDGTLRYESPSMERLLGLRPEERVGGDSFEFVHPDDIAKASDAFAELLQNPGATVHMEVRGWHSGGSWRTLQVVGRNLVDDPKVRGIVANFSDITERKEVEEALRESEEKFRRLVEDMNDGYCVIQESKVMFANARSAGMFGYDLQEVLGKTVAELLPSEVVRELSKMRAGRRHGEVVPEQYETVLVGKNGEPHPVELGTRMTTYEGKPALSVVVRDISERKKTEEALRASEQHYSALVSNCADGVLKFKDGIATWCNDRAEEIYGYSKEELIGKEASFFYPEHVDRKKFGRTVSGAINEKGAFCSTRKLQRGDGSTADIDYCISQIPDTNPIELVVVVRDITERRQMVEALRESEEQYSALVGNLADAVFRFKDGAITWGNDRIHEMLGYAKDEMIGAEVSLFVPGEDSLSSIYREVDHGLKERGQFHGTTQAKKKDGTIADIEYTASLIPGKEPMELVGVARDITERRRMEEALQRSERNYRVLFESRLDGVLVVDAETMKVIFANRMVAKMYGFSSADEMIGLDSLAFVHPDDRDKARRSIMDDVFEGKQRQIEDFRTTTSDGREIWISAVGTRMEYEGRLAGLISIRDITERKQAEQEKQRLEQQLQLSGRLAAVGELAAGVAHELNNPLAAVQAFAQFLTSRQDLNEAVRSDVETIYKEAQRATRITSNLLSFARRHKPEKILVSVNDIIEKSLELHSYRMKVNNIAISMELNSDLPRTMADFHQMQQVFVNLITNAEHAMTAANGKGMLSIKSQKAGEMVRITFTDDGPGISEDKLERIFDPFFTSKDVGEGTGLGLSICYGIVQEHGGHLYCRSKPGEGATFVVEIPVISEGQHPAEQSNSIEAEGVQNG
ncbi:MAG: PAS domain S-box protein [Dehalococcoidia bacterium]